MPYTFTPKFESDGEVSISKQETDAGDRFLSVSSGVLTVHFDSVSVDEKDSDCSTLVFRNYDHITQLMHVEPSDGRAIAEQFEDW